MDENGANQLTPGQRNNWEVPELIHIIQGYLSTRDIFKTRRLSRTWLGQADYHLKKRLTHLTVLLESQEDYSKYNEVFQIAERGPHTRFQIYSLHLHPQFLNLHHGQNPVKNFLTIFQPNVKSVELYISSLFNSIETYLSLGFFRQLNSLKILRFDPLIHILSNGDEQILATNVHNTVHVPNEPSPLLPNLQIVGFDHECASNMGSSLFEFLAENAPHLMEITLPPRVRNSSQEMELHHMNFFSAYENKAKIKITRIFFVTITDEIVVKLFQWQMSKEFKLKALGFKDLKFSDHETSLKILSQLVENAAGTLEELFCGNPAIPSDVSGLPVARSEQQCWFFFKAGRVKFSFKKMKRLVYTSDICRLGIDDQLAVYQFPNLVSIDLSRSSNSDKDLKMFLSKSEICPLVTRLSISQTEQEEGGDENGLLFFCNIKFPNITKFTYYLTSNLAIPFYYLTRLWTCWTNSLQELQIITNSPTHTPASPYPVDHYFIGLYGEAVLVLSSDGRYDALDKNPAINNLTRLETITLSGVCTISDMAVHLALAAMKPLKWLCFHGQLFPHTYLFSDRARAALCANGKRVINFDTQI